MTRSEAGRRGAAVANTRRKAENMAAYAAAPRRCAACDAALPYDRRASRFCSRSCAVSCNNRGVRRHGRPPGRCELCSAPLTATRRRFCGLRCAGEARRAGAAVVARWLAGKIVGHTGRTLNLRVAVHDHLLRSAGYACTLCGWDRRHPDDGRPLVEIDHIDGDAANTAPSNLRVLCPNCHSMTPTFRRRNVRSARSRNVPPHGFEPWTS